MVIAITMKIIIHMSWNTPTLLEYKYKQHCLVEAKEKTDPHTACHKHVLRVQTQEIDHIM